MKWILDRAQERSTWVGLTILAGALGVQIDPAQAQEIAGGAAALVGVVASVTKD